MDRVHPQIRSGTSQPTHSGGSHADGMTKSPNAVNQKGKLGRAAIAGVLAAVCVALGISIEDLTDTGHKTAAARVSSTADQSTKARPRSE
jgi:hypothetical protein